MRCGRIPMFRPAPSATSVTAAARRVTRVAQSRGGSVLLPAGTRADPKRPRALPLGVPAVGSGVCGGRDCGGDEDNIPEAMRGQKAGAIGIPILYLMPHVWPPLRSGDGKQRGREAGEGVWLVVHTRWVAQRQAEGTCERGTFSVSLVGPPR